jgi:hypothetical protein
MNGDLYSPVDEKRSVAMGPLVWGAILIVVGAGWLLAALDIANIPWRAALAFILIVVGVALLATASQGQAPEGLFTAGTVLAIVLALLSTASATFSLPLSGGFGDRSLSPTIATLAAEYRMVGGQLEISLRDVIFPEGETHIEVGVTFGRVVIDDIPDDVVVSVEGAVTAGELLLLGSRWDGLGIDERVAEPGFSSAGRRLSIDARVGFGQIEVNR